MQARKELNEYLDDSLINKLFSSNIPAACKKGPNILGIDEAGRGPVLGPMVYAVAFYPLAKEGTLKQMKFNDSKELAESTREKLFEAIQVESGGFQDLGYTIKIISPNMISNSMLRRKKYNLNFLSHDTAIDLIRAVESNGIQISHVYIDTVGPAEKYRDKMKGFFPKYQFTVTEKADSKYAIVSAASVCAKVMRDRIIQNWKYAESDDLHLDAFELGSGYPADPGTKKFLEASLDPVFGFSTLARFSWSTITKILEQKACVCDFNVPDETVVDPKQVTKQVAFMASFFKKNDSKGQNKKPNTSNLPARPEQDRNTNASTFFRDRSLSRVMLWT